MTKTSLLFAFFLLVITWAPQDIKADIASCKTGGTPASYALAVQNKDLKTAECLNKHGSIFKNTKENQVTLEDAIHFNRKALLEILIKNGGQLNWGGFKTWAALYFRISDHTREFSDLSRPISQIPLDGDKKPKERLADLKKLTPESEKVFIYLLQKADDQTIKQLSKNLSGQEADQNGSLLYAIASILCEVNSKKIMDTDKLLSVLIKRAQGKAHFGALDLFNSFTKLRTADGVHEDPACHEKISQAFIRKEDWRLITTKEGFEELGKKILGPEKYEKLKKERTKEPNS